MQTISFEEAAEKLSVKISKVRQWVKENRLLGAKNENGKLSVVADSLIKIDDKWEPVEHLPGTMTMLLDGGFSQTDAVAWLLRENASLGNEKPLDLIRAGGHHRVNRVAGTLAF